MTTRKHKTKRKAKGKHGNRDRIMANARKSASKHGGVAVLL